MKLDKDFIKAFLCVWAALFVLYFVLFSLSGCTVPGELAPETQKYSACRSLRERVPDLILDTETIRPHFGLGLAESYIVVRDVLSGQVMKFTPDDNRDYACRQYNDLTRARLYLKGEYL